MPNLTLRLTAVGTRWVLYEILSDGRVIAEGQCRNDQTITFIN